MLIFPFESQKHVKPTSRDVDVQDNLFKHYSFLSSLTGQKVQTKDENPLPYITFTISLQFFKLETVLTEIVVQIFMSHVHKYLLSPAWIVPESKFYLGLFIWAEAIIVNFKQLLIANWQLLNNYNNYLVR